MQTITFCGLHTYQIPSNAFTDKEDGTTRNLKLTLTKSNGQPVDDWMEFDAQTQVCPLKDTIPDFHGLYITFSKETPQKRLLPTTLNFQIMKAAKPGFPMLPSPTLTTLT